jgi:hypothetical protein
MDWFRWHHGTATDPKWRLVANASERSVTEVLAVWALILERGSQSAERGCITGWDDRVAAAALDLTPAAVQAIRDAMQEVTLTGEVITRWHERQPKREDGAAERARRWRAEKKREETQPNATERNRTPDKSRVEDTDKRERKRATALPDSWKPNEAHAALATERGVGLGEEAESFRDHAKANGRTLLDWDAGFRNWLRKATPRKGLHVVKGGKADEEYDDSWFAEVGG